MAVYPSIASLCTEYRLLTKRGANEARQLKTDEMRLKSEWSVANRANERGRRADAPAPQPPRTRPAAAHPRPHRILPYCRPPGDPLFHLATTFAILDYFSNVKNIVL